MATSLRPGFLWGAATAPHQVEGNNLNSDWWTREALMGAELSGDAVDSYHRYREDMQLLADAGLNSYGFGIEWARIGPRPASSPWRNRASNITGWSAKGHVIQGHYNRPGPESGCAAEYGVRCH